MEVKRTSPCYLTGCESKDHADESCQARSMTPLHLLPNDYLSFIFIYKTE